jgi:hypothetical protein
MRPSFAAQKPTSPLHVPPFVRIHKRKPRFVLYESATSSHVFQVAHVLACPEVLWIDTHWRSTVMFLYHQDHELTPRPMHSQYDGLKPRSEAKMFIIIIVDFKGL